MKKNLLLGVFLMLLLCIGAVPASAAFKDIKIDLTNGYLLTDEEISSKSAFSFGAVIGDDGSATRVAADDASANIVLNGKFHSNEHGWGNFSATVAVEGPVKVSMGSCAWGGDVTVKNAAGETVATFNTNNGVCYHNDKNANIVSAIYKGAATTLTISGGSYTPYIAVEYVDPSEIVNDATVTFSLGDVVAEGDLLPEPMKAEIGKTITIPANHTLYIAGKTLTGWTDGTKAYATGEEMTVSENVTLTPVFTDNAVSLADRTEAVTLKWNFRRDQGAPLVQWEGKAAQPYVTQATINGKTIDVKMDVLTTPGKFNTSSNTDWAQCNNGTTFTIPNAKGAEVSMEAYSTITTTTIDGQTDYTQGKTITYTVANTAETIDVVIGDGSYYRYVQVVLPVAESEGTIKEKLLYTTDFTDWTSVSASTTETQVEKQMLDGNNLTFTLYNVAVAPAGTNSKFKNDCVTTGYMQTAKTTDATAPYIITSAIADVTKVTFVQAATGSKRGMTLFVKGDGDADWVAIHNTAIVIANGETLTYDINRKNCQLKFGSFALNQNGYLLSLEISGNTLVTGEEYTLTATAAPAEGGEATIYPKADTYMENDEVTLTATPNFGYNFVNWTDNEGNVLSEEAKFKYTVTANAELTAKFKKVNTYAINVTVDGLGKDYMISYSPAPTVVDGKKMYEEGTEVTLTATSNEIVKFASWSDGQTTAEIKVNMTEDIALTASYSASDFIAIWDFYKKGNDGRIADFSAEGNEAASLVMRDEAGKTQGWLDKSQESGGYEGRPGGVNWKNDVALGTYYWQTKVDATNFTGIKVKSAMVYNYNAYTVYDLEYSLNGTDWTKLGSISMSGPKKWTDLTVDVPAEANNKDEVYFRWIADKTSKIDGTDSKNDGACIGAIYITGTEKILDDGKAPAVISTVPAEGSNTASANGKIVITFDKKVQLTGDAKAALGTEELQPVVSGKTVTCDYKGLSYSTDYTFTLKGNSVVDLTGNNKVADDIVINFTTRTKPEVAKSLYDVVVSTGEELAAAVKAANERTDKSTRYRIYVKKGTVTIPAYSGDVTVTVELADGSKVQKTYKEPRTYITANNISIIGEDYESTVITNTTPTEVYQGKYGPANIAEGIGNSDVFINSSTGLYLQGVTVKTSLGDAVGRDIAFQDKGNKTIMKDACLWGYQDTYVSNSDRSKYYFEGGVLRGRTDFLCGKGDVYYNQVTLRQVAGGYLAVPSVPKKYGYVFESCKIVGDADGVNGNYTLGRPWGKGTPKAYFLNTEMEVAPSAVGWNEMSGGWPARFAEYNSHLTSGTIVDLSQRKKTFGDGHENNPVLEAEEATELTLANVMGQDDDWDPTALTEQASAPTNVKYTETTLTWDDSNYVLGWVVFKNGEYVANVIEPTYTIDDTTATWTVRAANEMGGLGEAATATDATAIEDVISTGDNADAPVYNLAGQRLSKPQKGVNIIGGKKVIVK